MDALFVLCTFKGTIMHLFHPTDCAWYELPSIYRILHSPGGADSARADAAALFAASAAFVFVLRNFHTEFFFLQLLNVLTFFFLSF